MSIVSAEPSVAAEEEQRVCAEAETRYREHVLKLQAKYAQDCDAADRAREPRPYQPAELVRQGPGSSQSNVISQGSIERRLPVSRRVSHSKSQARMPKWWRS